LIGVLLVPPPEIIPWFPKGKQKETDVYKPTHTHTMVIKFTLCIHELIIIRETIECAHRQERHIT